MQNYVENMWCSLFLFQTRKGENLVKKNNQNCQFKQKIVTKTNLNIRNSMLMITFSVFDWKYLFGQVWSKNQNCQFKVKIGAQTNSNMENSIVKFFFFLFSTESILFLEICSKNQDCLLKLKFRTQINLNMQNWKVIFIFFQFGNAFFVLV